MASKRGQRRRQCGNKRKYEKDQAFGVSMRLRRQNPGQALDAYLCPTCGSWHVGHRTKKVRQQISTRRGQMKGKE